MAIAIRIQYHLGRLPPQVVGQQALRPTILASRESAVHRTDQDDEVVGTGIGA
ncbi:hypothetical protein D3C78_1722550 [compost metagenome]